MSLIHTITTTCLVGALGAAAAAQEGREDRRPENRRADQHSANYAALDTLIGAEVQLDPSAKERREAREEGEAADHPTGSIDEILVDPQNGKMQWAVIAFGGVIGIGDKTVAVPFRELTWQQKDDSGHFRLRATKAELEGLPAYDLDGAVERGLDESVKAAKQSWKAIREKAADAIDDIDEKSAADAASRRDRNGRTDEERDAGRMQKATISIGEDAYARASDQLVRASQLTDPDLYAQGGDEFGDVSKLIVDRTKGCIDFAVIDRGGVAGIGETSYLLPFSALTRYRSTEDEDELIYHVDRSTAALETSVKYEEPDEGVLDPAAARMAREQSKARSDSEETRERNLEGERKKDKDGDAGRR